MGIRVNKLIALLTLLIVELRKRTYVSKQDHKKP